MDHNFYLLGCRAALIKLGAAYPAAVYEGQTFQRRTSPLPASPTSSNLDQAWNDFDQRFAKNVCAPETTRYGE